jgi:hypothetical protein
VPLRQQVKILALLCVIAALNVWVAAEILGFVEPRRVAGLSAAIGLANAALPWLQLLFGGVAASRMVRVGADA